MEEYATLALSAYSHPTIPQLPFDDIHAPSVTIRQADDETRVIFRGSVTLEDWEINLKRGCSVSPKYHEGFMNAAKALLPVILPHITKPRVVFIGHSLGAAVAAYMLILHPQNARAVCFGCPSIMPPGQYNAVSYINGRDPVPRLVLAAGWTVPGEVVYLPPRSCFSSPIHDHSMDAYIARLR